MRKLSVSTGKHVMTDLYSKEADMASTPVSPKVKATGLWSIIAGLALIALTAVTQALTPETFSGLGVWGGVVYAAIIPAAGILAGYLKRDPLRDAGAGSVKALTAAVSERLAADASGKTPATPNPLVAQPVEVVEEGKTFGDPPTPPQ